MIIPYFNQSKGPEVPFALCFGMSLYFPSLFAPLPLSSEAVSLGRWECVCLHRRCSVVYKPVLSLNEHIPELEAV